MADKTGIYSNGNMAPEPQANEETPLIHNPQPTTEGEAFRYSWRLVVIFISMWVGVFLAALDSTIIATLSAPISISFNSLSLLSWLASGYLIATAACQPLSGRLTDIYGRRAGALVSNVLFAAGTLLCGLSTNIWMMIAGRVISGLGGGGLTAISTFVSSDLVPLRNRGFIQGAGFVFYSTGAALGGLFGGWVNDTWNWRW
jgi:MFS family permease